MNREYFLVFGLSLALRMAALATPTPFETAGDPVLGNWIFHGKFHVTIADDGTARYATGMQGTWRYLERPTIERTYQIVWDNGVYIDTLTLSKDGRRLEGRNKHGKHISAERALEVPRKKNEEA